MRVFFALCLAMIFACLGFIQPASAQSTATTENAKVTLTSETDAVVAGEPFHLSIDFELADHWHIYWKNPGDSGLAPHAKWSVPEGFEMGELLWPTPKKITMEGLVNYGYEGKVSLPLVVSVPSQISQSSVTFDLNLDWLICKEVCIPESAELSLTLPVKGVANKTGQTLFEGKFNALPKSVTGESFFEDKPDGIYLKIPLENDGEGYFYPLDDAIIDYAAEQQILRDGQSLIVKLQKGALKSDNMLKGVLRVGGDAFEVNAILGEVDSSVFHTSANISEDNAGLGLLFALFSAFLGGLILNAMPCVFPVLSLKALSLSQKAQNSLKSVRWQGLSYLGGVLVSFLVLGIIMILLKQSGQVIGWGFQLQSPIFVSFMLILFFLLGLSLVGFFNLPILFGQSAQEAEMKQSGKGSFITGVLAVMVATPCAVPFMAPAVGYAFAQSAPITLLIMLALGLGLALPYLALAWYPSLHRYMPKPGAWMNRFKEFMAFPMFLSAIWLLWVLAQQVTIHEVAIILLLLLLISFLIWLGQGKGRVTKLILWIVALFAAFSLLADIEASAQNQSEQGDYAELSIPFDSQRLAQLRADGQPVFVNATAAWCLTCKVNERVALRSPEIAQAFADKEITYMVADWTNRNDEITFWLEEYDRSGVPLYVYYPPNQAEAVVLPQLLSVEGVLEVLHVN